MNKKNVCAVGHEIYIERGGAGGRAIDYWLQAAAELGRLLPHERHVRRRNGRIGSSDSGRPGAKVAAGVRK